MSDVIGPQWQPQGQEARPDMDMGMGVETGLASSSNGLDARPNKGMGMGMGMGVGSGQDNQGVSTGTSVDSARKLAPRASSAKVSDWAARRVSGVGSTISDAGKQQVPPLPKKGNAPQATTTFHGATIPCTGVPKS